MTDLIRSATDWAPFFRKRIAAAGLTCSEVDERIYADCEARGDSRKWAPGYANKICNGKKSPGALTIERICTALKISLRPVVDGDAENSALPHGDKPQQLNDTPNNGSDLHGKTETGDGAVRTGIAGEAAGASGPHGCAITGAQCGHPFKIGGVGPRLMADETVRAVYRAAAEKLGTRR